MLITIGSKFFYKKFFSSNFIILYSTMIISLYLTKHGRDGPWVGPFQNCVRQPRPPFKMATVTKNRNFFKCPKLLYFKPECAQM